VRTGFRRRYRLADVCCIGGLLAGTALGYAMVAATAALLYRHTVLLEVLSGGTVSMVTAGALARVGRLSLFVAFVAPLAGVVVYDVFYWWAGRRYGERAVARLRSSQLRGGVRRAERLVARYGFWALAAQNYLPVPDALVQASTGMAGMPLLWFLLGDVVGWLLWEALVVGLGYAIGRPAVHVAHLVSRDALVVTIVLVLGLLAWAFVRRRRASLRGRWESGPPRTGEPADPSIV
jgi:membrane-associated protein